MMYFVGPEPEPERQPRPFNNGLVLRMLGAATLEIWGALSDSAWAHDVGLVGGLVLGSTVVLQIVRHIENGPNL